MKLWLNEHKFVELSGRTPGETEKMFADIAVRSRTIDWMGFYAYLPDPDPVLEKLGQTLPVYRQLLSDAHVWSCYISRKAGTLNQDWEILEGSEGGERRNKAAHDLVLKVMKGLDVRQIITEMLDAPFYGMSPVEVVWEYEGGTWIPDRVEGKPPEWFVFSTENELRFLSRENMIEGEALPPMKFLLPRHHATYQNPYGERVLSRCFWPVVFKKGGFKFWSIFTEKFGMPWVIGKVPRSTNETERARLADNLIKMVQDAVAVLNDDENIEIKEQGDKKGSADIYEKLVGAANREISKAILGQTLSTELDKGGSYAAAEAHLEVRQDLVEMDRNMVASAFNTLFKWETDLNFTGAIPPEFGFYQEEDVQKDLADRDQVLSQQGVRFTKDYYRKAYNLEEGDFDLTASGGQGLSPFFSEMRPSRAQVGFSQAEIDQLSRHMAEAHSEAISEMLAPVLDHIANANDYNEIAEKIYGLYPEIDTAAFERLMTRALFAADLWGHVRSKNA